MVKQIFKILVALVVIGIPVGIRVLIHSFTPGFHEYEAAFFYFLSDIPLAIVSVYGYYCFFRMRHPRSLFAFLFVFLLFALASLLFALDTLLAFYGFFRLFLAVGFALTIRDLFFRIEDRTMLYGLILFLAFSESVLAFLQFRFQGNVGLGFLGESPIGALIPGTAKSILSDARVVRAYGTFLHPNILGAFLLLGLGVLMYFWFSVKIPRLVFTGKNYGKLFKKYLPVMLKTMLFSAILFVILVGITVTFSRTAWVLSLLLVCFFGIYFLFFKKYWRQAAKLLVTVAVSVYFLLTVFSPFIAPRAKVSLHEPSVTERVTHLELGVEMLEARPEGVGIGNEVTTAVHDGWFEGAGIRNTALFQPIHNVYLLIATEIGIAGLVAFLFFIALVFLQNKKVTDLPLRYSNCILLATLLVFALFDHFFWTLDQGRLMLWLTIGLLMIARTRSDAPVGTK